MQAEDIQRIAGWLAATDIGVLELRGPGTALRMRHDGADMAIDTRADVDDDADTAATALTVAAPGVGVFLRRHPLRNDDLVVPGSAVAAGQVLGLLLIGPLLRPVLAPAEAIVLNLLAPHGAPVGYGTPLATLSPTA